MSDGARSPSAKAASPICDAVMAVMDDSFDPRFGEAWTASQCAGLLPMPGVWLTLAREDDAVVGFALARVVADEAELLLLAVRSGRAGPGHRPDAARALRRRTPPDAGAARSISKSAKEIMPLAFTSGPASPWSAAAAIIIAAQNGDSLRRPDLGEECRILR